MNKKFFILRLNRPGRAQVIARAAVILLVIFVQACSLPGGQRPTAAPTITPLPPTASPQPTPTRSPLPPALVESSPPDGYEIPIVSPIALYFNQPMNQQSVESALAASNFTLGELVWQDNTVLTINPAEALPPDASIALSVAPSALSAQGLSLTEPISLTYRTQGYLTLVETLPEPGSNDFNPSSAVVAAFSHPVVPLGADPDALDPAFSLMPPANGRGEWLNTSTYIFYPEPPLQGGLAYSVLVNPLLRGLDGNPLESLPDWTFITAQPRLVSVQPDLTEKPVRLDAKFTLDFNQPMDSASVEAGFQLLDPVGSPTPGIFEWNDKNTVFTFTPTNQLERNAGYILQIDGQVQARGGTPLDQPFVAGFTTVPELGILSTTPGQGGVKNVYEGVTINFTGPIESKNITEFISFDPRLSNTGTYWDEASQSLYIYGDYLPSTTYNLTLSPDITDPWGSTLGGESSEPYVLTFDTSALPPGVFIGTGYTNTPFITAEDESLAAQVSGISTLSTTVGSLPLSDFLRMSDENGYEFRQFYMPIDAQTWLQPLNNNPDRMEPVNIYLSPDQQPLPPGLYFLRLRTPEDASFDSNYVVAVSNIHTTLKLGAADALAWAVDLTSGAAQTGADITLYDQKGSVLASGQTDSQGIFAAGIPARSDSYSPVMAVIGEPGQPEFSFTYSHWTSGIEPWFFDINTDYSGPQNEVYLYTDRPIYQPGQTVYFRAVVREAFNGRYQLADLTSLPLKVYNGSGFEIDTFDLPLSEFGTAHGEFNLSPEAPPGYYSLGVQEPFVGGLGFQVADYRKPEINLQVAFTDEQALVGRTLHADVNARYFFDAPAGNLPVKWRLYAEPSYFDLPGYTTGLQGAESWSWSPVFGGFFGESILEGEALTQPDGTLKLDITPPTGDNAPSDRQKYTLEVAATDESGFPVSARNSIQVNPADYYIGVQPESWVGRAGEQAGYKIQAADWNLASAGEKSMRAEYSKVAWTLDEDSPSDPFLGQQYIPEYTPVASTDFRTNQAGQARLAFTPPEPGTYEIKVYDLTPGQNQAQTNLLVWVGGPGQATWPNKAENRLSLTADQDGYQPGQTAQVFVPNPFPSTVQALVTEERGIVIRHQILNLEPGGTILSFPLTAEDAPNIYVTVTLIGQHSLGWPDFRQGYLNLPVEPSQQTLNVSLTGEPMRTGPGEQVSFEILVTDADAKPVQGEFSLSVVDLAALALADPNSLDIVPAYYDNQPLGIQTAVPLTAYAAEEADIPGGGGGGGGDGGMPEARDRFPDTAFWQADIVTDENGKATVTMMLPDSLTTWQVETRGLTIDTQVGQAMTQIITTQDLIVRPVTPRFLVAGDHTELAAIVQNNTEDDLLVDVSLQAGGVELDDQANITQQTSVPAGGRARVSWWGVVQDEPTAELVFTAAAQSGMPSDAAKPPQGDLPILRYLTPHTFRTAGTLDAPGERLELVSLPYGYEAGQTGSQAGSLELELAPSLAAGMLDGFEVLENEPYPGMEQALSRYLPNLEYYRTLEQFGLSSPSTEARLDRTLDRGLEDLLAGQNYDGGWGWWPGTESDLTITAYILFGLVRTRAAGIAVPETAIQRAVEYLNSMLDGRETPSETWVFDQLTFVNYALTLAGAGDQARLDLLYESRDRLNPWAKALLALSLEELNPGSPEASSLITDLETSALRSASGAHWELIDPSWQNLMSPLTNSAIVVYALAERDPGSPLIADAVRYLMAHREADGAWASSYTTAWTLMALTQVMQGTSELGGNFEFGALLNGTSIASGQAAGPDALPPVETTLPLSSLYPDAPNELTIQHGDGPGRLYYNTTLSVHQPADQAEAVSQGLGISRAYYPGSGDCLPGLCAPAFSAARGDKVQVRLTLNVPQDVYYLAVEDFIPAGAEILDTSLKTSQQGEPDSPDVVLQYDPENPFGGGWGWWNFNSPQIHSDHISFTADYLPAGVYELTYTFIPLQAGQYQVLPARTWQLYFPEVQGRTTGTIFEIK